MDVYYTETVQIFRKGWKSKLHTGSKCVQVINCTDFFLNRRIMSDP